MSGFLTDVGNFADTVGNKIESGFSNLGRKTVDLSDEEKKELDSYFDATDSENVGGFGLSEEQEERYGKYSKMGWRREMDEDGNFVYSREKTSKEMQEQLEGAIPAGKAASRAPQFSQKPPSMPSMPRGSVGYRQLENPYKVPSYLMNSAQYNEQISKLIGGLLKENIRSNPLKTLV